MTTEFLKPDLEKEEGRKNSAYVDTTGNVTWGIGHKDNRVKIGTLFTDQQVDDQFNLDVDSAKRGISQYWPPFNTLTDLRQDAIVNMSFELGVSGLLEFTTFLSFLEFGKYSLAALDLHGTLWFKQVPNRAKRIADQIASNTHQE